MLSKNVPTICLFMMTLIAFMLLSFSVRADVLSDHFSASNTTVGFNDSSYSSDGVFDAISQKGPGCCDTGGSCAAKRCCSPGSSCSGCLVGNSLYSYAAPSRLIVDAIILTLYSSADMHSLYRPPIV